MMKFYREKVLLVCSLAALYCAGASAAVDLPYTQDFATESAFDNLTVIDANHDGTKWQWDSSGRAKISFNQRNAMDDWLILPAVQLKAGNSYKVSFDVIPHMTRYITERIEVKWGDAPTVEGMTGVLLESTDLILDENRDEYAFHFEKTVKPTADGIYYIGFHGISDRDQSWLAVDNVTIDAPVTSAMPGAPGVFTVTPILDGSARVDISVKAPEQTTAGDALQSMTRLEVSRNDEVVKTFDNPAPGDVFDFSDTGAMRGRTVYRARAYSESGPGEEAMQEVYVDIAVPSCAPWVKAVENATEGQVTVTWAAPTTDLEGRTIDPAPLRYDLITTNGYTSTEITTGVQGLTYTYQALLPGEPQKFMQIGVKPTYKGEYDVNHVSRSEPFVVGAPYSCPFAESFPGGNEEHIINTTVESDEGIWGVFNDSNDFGVTSHDGDGGFIGFLSQVEGDRASLTLGKISLKDVDSPVLMFYIYNPEGQLGADLDEVEVKIFSDGIWTQQRLFALETLPLADKWNLVTVPLDSYKGKVIQPQFDITVVNGGIVLFDNIQVKSQHAIDLAAISLTAPAEAEADKPFNLNLTVANTGAATVSQYSVTLYRNNVAVSTVDGVEAAPAEEVTVSIPEVLNVSNEGRVRYHAVIEAEGDGDTGNNVSESRIVTLKASPLPAPQSLTAVTDNGNVTLRWEEPDYSAARSSRITEGFETAESWAIDNVEGWTFIDVDKSATGAFGFDFPGKNSPMAYQVFDRNYREFASEGGFDGVDGSTKYLASFYSTGSANDDWAISPQLNGEAQTVSLYARSFDGNYPESFEVLYSNGGLETTGFIRSGNSVSAVPAEWTQYSFDIPAGAEYFAIRHTSADKFILFIDDVSYTTALLADGERAAGYNVYRDGTRINETPVTECNYTDILTDSEEHTYAVSAVYERGESGISNLCVVKGSGMASVGDDTVTISVSGNVITVAGSQSETVIVAADGRVAAILPAAVSASAEVEPGIYIVRTSGKTAKVIVR